MSLWMTSYWLMITLIGFIIIVDCLQSLWPMHVDAWDKHWGMYHELGHNIARPYWILNEEATVNVFAMFLMENIAGVNRLE